MSQARNENRKVPRTLRDEIIAARDSLHHHHRDLIFMILDEMKFDVSLTKQIILIHKKWGLFEINLINTDVNFTPSTCLHCQFQCTSKKRRICIIPQDTQYKGVCLVRNHNSIWEDAAISTEDLLILSKAIALENNLLPRHVINQIVTNIYCNFILGSEIQLLIDITLREYYSECIAKEDQMSIRTRLLNELHDYFQQNSFF